MNRCNAAHIDDSTPCDGAADAVIVEDSHGAQVTGCVHHGASMLASIQGAKIRPGTSEGAATEAFTRAQTTRPFGFLRR